MHWGAISAASKKFDTIKCYIFMNGLDREEIHSGCKIEYIYLGAPRFLVFAVNILGKVLAKKWSFNEALYFDKKKLSIIYPHLQQADFVYCDMIRLAPYASCSIAGFHLDIDDLLSSRYMKFSYMGGVGFGFGEKVFPVYLRKSLLPLLRKVSSIIFKIEAKLMFAREAYWTDLARTASLVSPLECSVLEAKVEKSIQNIPMALPSTGVRWEVGNASNRRLLGVFIGSIDIPGNYLSLKKYVESTTSGNNEFDLSVVGKASSENIEKLSAQGVDYLGYVDSLSGVIISADFIFCPIYGGTGIKTKVVEALSYGIPIATTEDGLSGLDISRDLVFVFNLSDGSLSEFVDNYRAYCSAASVQSRIDYFNSNFEESVVQGKWLSIFQQY